MGALRIFRRLTELLDTAFASEANDDFVQRKAGAWTNRTVAQVKTDLGLSGTNTGDQATSTGGNAAADSGKSLIFSASGTITGTTSVSAKNAVSAQIAGLTDEGAITLFQAGDAVGRELVFPTDIADNEAKEVATRNWTTAGFVAIGGNLGTPSGGDLSNCTGTGSQAKILTIASIGI